MWLVQQHDNGYQQITSCVLNKEYWLYQECANYLQGVNYIQNDRTSGPMLFAVRSSFRSEGLFSEIILKKAGLFYLKAFFPLRNQLVAQSHPSTSRSLHTPWLY